MTLVLRPNDLGPDDYSVRYKSPLGSEINAGRIFKTFGKSGSVEMVWMWTVEFHQRRGRAEPHQGTRDAREEAMAAFRECWESFGQEQRKA